MSAGLPGMMKDIGQQERGDKCFAGPKDERDCDELRALVELVGDDWVGNGHDTGSADNADGEEAEEGAMIEDQEKAVYAFAGALRFVPFSLIPEKLRNLGRWYDLADRGLVQMRDTVNNEVAFGSYLVYFTVRAGMKGACVTAQEAAHLGAVTPEAEPIALRLLAANAEKLFKLKLDDAAVPVLPKSALVEELGLRMYKDLTETSRDACGSDGVILCLGRTTTKWMCTVSN